MNDADDFCAACYRYEEGDRKPSVYLSCPACGHIYLSELDKNIRNIYLEKIPNELLAAQNQVQNFIDQIENELGVNRNKDKMLIATINLDAKHKI